MSLRDREALAPPGEGARALLCCTVAKTETAKEDVTLGGIGRDLKRYAMVLLGLVAVLWSVEISSWLFPIDSFGVHPRTTRGLVGILFHPFLHTGIGHVSSNSVGLLVFGAMVMLKEERDFYVTFVLSSLVGGLGIWLIGATNSNHIGASGVVFGLFGYLLSTGWFERKIGSMALSLLVAVGWGGMLIGVTPGQDGVSWEGHLFGCLGGALSAWLLAKVRARGEAKAAREARA